MSEDFGTVLPLPFWAILLIVIFCWPSIVFAEPRFAVTDGKIAVTLYDDPCELKDTVSNLPYKATWTEGDKTYNGCWGPWVNDQKIVAYFTDKTIAVIPFSAVTKVSGA